MWGLGPKLYYNIVVNTENDYKSVTLLNDISFVAVGVELPITHENVF